MLFNLFNDDSWARAEPGIRKLPGSQSLCEQVAKGAAPWPSIAGAMSYCSSFPTHEFTELLASGHFDVRWPLTFAAWYWGSSGASVDKESPSFFPRPACGIKRCKFFQSTMTPNGCLRGERGFRNAQLDRPPRGVGGSSGEPRNKPPRRDESFSRSIDSWQERVTYVRPHR